MLANGAGEASDQDLVPANLKSSQGLLMALAGDVDPGRGIISVWIRTGDWGTGRETEPK